MKIRNKLIRLLGGVPMSTLERICKGAIVDSMNDVANESLEYAKSLNGLNGDEWAKKVYNHLLSTSQSDIDVKFRIEGTTLNIDVTIERYVPTEE